MSVTVCLELVEQWPQARQHTLTCVGWRHAAGGAVWHVDVYSSILKGVVIAEIELKHESQELILPRWIGKEVTGDSFYRKINIRARALNAQRES